MFSSVCDGFEFFNFCRVHEDAEIVGMVVDKVECFGVTPGVFDMIFEGVFGDVHVFFDDNLVKDGYVECAPGG